MSAIKCVEKKMNEDESFLNDKRFYKYNVRFRKIKAKPVKPPKNKSHGECAKNHVVSHIRLGY